MVDVTCDRCGNPLPLQLWEEFKVMVKLVDNPEEIKKINIAKRHKPFNPGSELHKKFLEQHYSKANRLQSEHPYLDLSKELEYFSGN